MRTVQEGLTEDAVEAHLVRWVKRERGLCIKVRFIRGFPDRIVLLPDARILFVELKRPKGGQFEPLQLRWHDKLRKLGFTVRVWRTKGIIDAYFQGLL
jgi:hypothetical protein